MTKLSPTLPPVPRGTSRRARSTKKEKASGPPRRRGWEGADAAAVAAELAAKSAAVKAGVVVGGAPDAAERVAAAPDVADVKVRFF